MFRLLATPSSSCMWTVRPYVRTADFLLVCFLSPVCSVCPMGHGDLGMWNYHNGLSLKLIDLCQTVHGRTVPHKRMFCCTCIVFPKIPTDCLSVLVHVSCTGCVVLPLGDSALEGRVLNSRTRCLLASLTDRVWGVRFDGSWGFCWLLVQHRLATLYS